MKKIFFLLLISIPYIAMAQNFNYEKQWKEIEKLSQNGEVKSLLPQINKIYNQAKKENNSLEIIRSFLYKSEIVSQTFEDKYHDPFKYIILEVEKEIPSSKGINRSILQSMLAKLYEKYADDSRWIRRDMTEVQDNSEDISTWTTQHLWQKSSDLYKESINNKEILQNAKTENWEKILTDKEDINLYPTLYDILVFRYIEFLSKNYSVNNNTGFNEENKKIKESLFQDVIKFHQNDAEKSAYLNAKLEEIKDKNTTPEETTKELLALAEAYPKENFSAYIYYSAAESIVKTDKVKAFEICNKVAKAKNNPWAVNCTNFQQALQLPSLSVNIDNVLLPNENIPLFVTAKNLDKIYYRIYEVNPTEFGQVTEKNSLIKNGGIYSANAQKLIKNGSIEVKPFNDYSNHSTIARLEGLPQGNYKIEFANSANFMASKDTNDKLLGTSYFMVNNWAVVETESGGGPAFQLVERKTGKVIPNTSVQVFNKVNNWEKMSRILSEPITKKTDANGFIQLSEFKKNPYTYFYIYNPEANSYIQLSSRYYYASEKDNNFSSSHQISFFTDRAIYRPGQKVYFKAILYQTNKEKSTLTKNQKVTFKLYNPNNEVVSTLELVSNNYGSAFGEFILPQGGLTGSYHIESDYTDSRHSFSVEEYKRPKFEVILEKPEGEYTLDKEVKASGKAMSFSGSSLSEAKVVYRVERQEIFPYYYRGYFPVYNAVAETIAQGETTTDNEGKFSILFTAKSKKSLENHNYRTYTYTLYADVTDINGETHSAESSITIGDLPKKLSLQIPEKSTQKECKQIVISSTSLNDVKLPSQGKIILTELIVPKKIILPNKSSQIPDYQLYDEKTFNQYFPFLPYSKEEQNPKYWKRGKEIAYSFDTKKSDTVAITHPLSRGYYLVQAITLYGKDSIQTQKVIEISDNQTLKSTDNLFFSVHTDKSSYKAGETITLDLLSDLEDATGILHVESGNKWILHKEIPLRGGKASFSLPAKQEYVKDGLFITAYVIKENGYKNQTWAVPIKDESKELKITTKVFRDKITPGAKEKWELTISGANKDKVTAEVLASMYDASLDQFQSNSYSFSPWDYSPYGILYNNLGFLGYTSNWLTLNPYYRLSSYRIPHVVNIKDFSIHNSFGILPVMSVRAESNFQVSKSEIAQEDEQQDRKEKVSENVELSNKKNSKKSSQNLTGIQARTNLQETAFFYPNLYTDEKGNVTFSFTSPEALTKWKLLILAHTRDLQSGTAEFYTQTQKDLMVVPNVPRFLREGDQITISTKISNLSGKNLTGKTQLFLWDALTHKPVNIEFSNSDFLQSFQANASKNTVVNWSIKVPKNVQAVTYRIVAQAGDFSDGEENILPVLTNRMLVTETLPVSVKENQTKEFRLDKLITHKSESLQNFNLSVELTTNPVWLAVMSLPYLREYPYECSEQLFSRLYGNILSGYIVNSSPKIKRVFDNWNAQGVTVSQLEKNQELKDILLEETPWIRNAENEKEQKKRIALFFDLNQMKNETEQAQNKLIRRQNGDGGFAWFEGGESSPYITEHIILGFGQLKFMLKEKAGTYLIPSLKQVIKSAIEYSDKQTIQYINSQIKEKQKVDGRDLMHYYYVRSFWREDYKIPAQISRYLNDITKNISLYFKNYDLQAKAMTALVLNRYGYPDMAKKIIHNLKETAVESDELGMYWKENQPGWYEYQAPVDTQARLIEAFAEITPADVPAIEEMKVWLLKNRQTNAWNSTKATTNAVYALMNFGKDWTNAEKGVKAWVGGKQFYPPQDSSAEQISGYYKQSWNAEQIKPEMGVVKVEKTSPGVAWGGIYWQYFEDLDKITQADTRIKMQKQLFLKINTDRGQQLQPVTDQNPIKVGDCVTIRLIIKTDRDMEYIHIKDMRASGFEPVNVLSGYKFQNGASYYESTRDAATNFFFERLPQGTYVFEYDVRANNKGEFSNGITQLQNMYAPEMSAHSEGIQVNIK